MEDNLHIARSSYDQMTLVQLAVTLRPDQPTDHDVILALASRGFGYVNIVLAAIVADTTVEEGKAAQSLYVRGASSYDIPQDLRTLFQARIEEPPVKMLEEALLECEDGKMDMRTTQCILDVVLTCEPDELSTLAGYIDSWLGADWVANEYSQIVHYFVSYVRSRLQERIKGS